jgi:hypothetical protein
MHQQLVTTTAAPAVTQQAGREPQLRRAVAVKAALLAESREHQLALRKNRCQAQPLSVLRMKARTLLLPLHCSMSLPLVQQLTRSQMMPALQLLLSTWVLMMTRQTKQLDLTCRLSSQMLSQVLPLVPQMLLAKAGKHVAPRRANLQLLVCVATILRTLLGLQQAAGSGQQLHRVGGLALSAHDLNTVQHQTLSTCSIKHSLQAAAGRYAKPPHSDS